MAWLLRTLAHTLVNLCHLQILFLAPYNSEHYNLIIIGNEKYWGTTCSKDGPSVATTLSTEGPSMTTELPKMVQGNQLWCDRSQPPPFNIQEQRVYRSLVSSVGTILQYYHHYTKLGYTIFIIASIVNIVCVIISQVRSNIWYLTRNKMNSLFVRNCKLAWLQINYKSTQLYVW